MEMLRLQCLRHTDRLHHAHARMLTLGGGETLYQLLTIYICLVQESFLDGEQLNGLITHRSDFECMCRGGKKDIVYLYHSYFRYGYLLIQNGVMIVGSMEYR